MKIHEITGVLEQVAPRALQESYDNCGLLLGNPDDEVTAAMISLDATPQVVKEAAEAGCNLLISHHPAIFSGLKSLSGNTFTHQVLQEALRYNIGLYTIHTNLDNVLSIGVNRKIGEILGVKPIGVLQPLKGVLRKLVTFCPEKESGKVLSALFEAGAGIIGKYSECSFSAAGTGTFKAGEGTNPFVGNIGERHHEPEHRIELIFPFWLERELIKALHSAHPYEEVAYDIYKIENTWNSVGAGAYGDLDEAIPLADFFQILKRRFHCGTIRHTAFAKEKKVKRLAWCGGSGSFLLQAARTVGADVYITGDFKYHQFFETDPHTVIADIGHFESEQYTPLLVQEIIHSKFPNFAALLSKSSSNPVFYY